MQIKLIAIFAFVLLVLVILNIRIAYITTQSGDKYAKKVLSQQEYNSVTIPFKRGEIRDRNNNVLARSEKVYNVILDCYAVNGNEDYVEPTINALVSALGLDEAEIRSRLTSEETKDSQYQILKKKISLDEKNKFEEMTSLDESEKLTKEQRQERENVQGVWFEEQYVRTYPMSDLASNVIGFSNDLDDGICGLESYYTDVLNGVDGREFGYLNSDSELERTIIEPQNGNTIISTIDVNIQQIVEKYIQEFEEEHSAGPNTDLNGRASKNLAVIVANPQNGEILAMATDRSFDLNDPQNLSEWYTDQEVESMTDEEHVEALNEMWYNYCVSEAFEPGSTFKPITVASALEMGALTGDESFYCDGHEFVTDTDIRCDNVNGHGEETLSDVIKNSCNDGMMQIAFKMKVDNFLKYQSLFHFGKYTGIDLPNESQGILHTKDTMHEVQLATSSFGQTFTCTMIQELAAFNAVVNGGYYYQPHLVKQVLDASGGVARNMEPVLLNQPVSARSSQMTLEALEKGVKEGTGQKAQVPGYRVAGKTGTAEKYPRGNGKYLVSFIGCAPVENPQISIYVVIDEPNVSDQTTGGYSMTIARKIMTEVLPYLGIYQTEEITDEVLEYLGITREDAEAGRVVEKEQETDENGNPVETSQTDEYGNPISTEETDAYGNPVSAGETDAYGNSVSTGETDAYGNPASTGETDAYGNPAQTEETEQGAVSNPDIPRPPEDTDQSGQTQESQGGITNEDLGIE